MDQTAEERKRRIHQHIKYWRHKAEELETVNVWRRQNKHPSKCLLVEPQEMLQLLSYIQEEQ